MHFVEIGSGTPLLVIHGFCVDHRLLLGLDPALAARGGWRRVYIDLPGMGLSAAGPDIRSADDVAAAVASFARKAFGIQRFAVLGNSFGGIIARHLVAEFGDQVLGLALLCPVAVAEHGRRRVPPRTVLHTDEDLLASLDQEDAAAYQEMAVLQTPENWARFRDSALPGLRSFDRKAIGRIAGRYPLAIEPEDRASTFRGPTLVIAGRQDHVVGYQDLATLAGRYENSTFSILERAGHNAHLDQPELTAGLLEAWLARMDELLPLLGGTST
ncbi:alpha/beta fold hydrolase [Paeniglutamicibacter sp. ORCA_105]|uniref:alpha/beta fold hydrolase n=1 Tax=Paeniglutamicibacter sp. ORCA_105 TaxID=3377336 RepID=UPI003895B549